MGMERLISLMPEAAGQPAGIDLALVALGREAWEVSIGMAQRLRARGVGCLAPLAERPLGAQLRRADKSAARFALFVGKEEIAAQRFTLKDLRTGQQSEVGEDEVPDRLREGRS
jgi:histidyl-tRNA synthetase